MSHFTVLVIGENWEKQLEPFDENLETDFQDETADYQKEWEEDKINAVKLADGTFKFRWDDMFSNPDYHYLSSNDDEKHIYPADSELVEVPYNEFYSSFEEFAKDYHGSTANASGRYGYWHNPKAKWDWYQMGGRWRGYFPAKLTAGKVAVGQAGVFDNEAKSPHHVDQLRIKDIDFLGADLEVAVEANKTFDKWEALINKFDPKHKTISWAIFAARFMDDNDPLTRDEARKEYRSQPLIKASEESEDFKNYWGCLVEDLGFDSEAYVNRRRESRFVTHSVVYNGEWYEQGRMGWFGVVTDEKDGDAWNTQFHKLLKSLPEDTLVTLVDCHI